MRLSESREPRSITARKEKEKRRENGKSDTTNLLRFSHFPLSRNPRARTSFQFDEKEIEQLMLIIMFVYSSSSSPAACETPTPPSFLLSGPISSLTPLHYYNNRRSYYYTSFLIHHQQQQTRGTPPFSHR